MPQAPHTSSGSAKISKQAHEPGRRAPPPRRVREGLLQHTRHPQQLGLAPVVAHELHGPRELRLLVVADGHRDRGQPEQVGQEDVPHEPHDQRDVVLARAQRGWRDPRREEAAGGRHLVRVRARGMGRVRVKVGVRVRVKVRVWG